MAHRIHERLQLETNYRVYARLYKLAWTRKAGHCPRCPAHRGENIERVPRRSWKAWRKTQYRVLTSPNPRAIIRI